MREILNLKVGSRIITKGCLISETQPTELCSPPQISTCAYSVICQVCWRNEFLLTPRFGEITREHRWVITEFISIFKVCVRWILRESFNSDEVSYGMMPKNLRQLKRTFTLTMMQWSSGSHDFNKWFCNEIW